MLILGIDFETMGLNPDIHPICEVGAVLWDTEAHRSVQSLGCLLKVDPDSPFEQEAIDTHGLTFELLAKYGKEPLPALKRLLNMYMDAEYVVAHNGNACDRPFLRAWIQKSGLEFDEDKFWIDTLTDIEYPKKWNKQLTCLAAYHDFLNPFPHEAVGDVLTMLKVLDHYDMEKIITYAKTPWIGARITLPFEKNQWAKDHGYFWFKNETSKFWMKKMKEDKFEAEKAEVTAAGFILTKLDAIPDGVY